jgi:hypothetical protein
MPITPPTDLSARPPRSARVRLGGYAILPRMLDKCRAELAGTANGYTYGCSLDKRLLDFAGVDADALKAEVAKGLGDGAIIVWFRANGKNRRTESEIAAWTHYQENRVPENLESREKFSAYHRESGAHRDDIGTWFDVLDLDDHASYGGKA